MKKPTRAPEAQPQLRARAAARFRERAERKARWLEAASRRIADPDWQRFDWGEIFEDDYKCDGASKQQLRQLEASISRPLSENEIRNFEEAHYGGESGPVDPRLWKLPAAPLPRSYLHFLRWSNGGEFLHGDRQISPFFTTSDVRDYLVSYAIPEYMPGAVPIAFNGGGSFYLFDMRAPAVDGEFPILYSDAGNLGYEDDESLLVASSFYAFCLGTTNPSDIF